MNSTLTIRLTRIPRRQAKPDLLSALLRSIRRIRRAGFLAPRCIAPAITAILILVAAGCRPLGVFTVNSSADHGDSHSGDGICRTAASATECTLRAALEEANALAGTETIQFNLPAGSEAIFVTSMLPEITGSLTLDGTTQPGYDGDNPRVQINGQYVSTPYTDGLRMQSGSDVTVKALKILNFSNNGIFSGGKLTVDRSVFTANHGYGIGSSAVSPDSVVNTVRNSTMSGNGEEGLYAWNKNLSLEHVLISQNSGPGIANLFGSLSLNDVTIYDNDATSSAYWYSGGIYFQGDGVLTITGSTIQANTAMDGRSLAGGIAINGGSANITDTLITDNQGFASGGMYIQGGSVHLDGCTLSRNVGWHAGGVFLSDEAGGELWVENGTRIGKPGEGNTASIYSEGYRYGGGIFNQRNIHVSDSYIENNSGVGIQSEFSADTGSMEITRSHIDGNTLGGIVAWNANLTFTDSALGNNGGNGIAMQEGNLLLQNGNVEGNEGIGINLAGTNLQMANSSVNRNADHGIAAAAPGATPLVNALIEDSRITENGGRGMSAESANLVINGTTVQGNRAGGIAADNARINMTNCTLSGNQTPGNGGGMYGHNLIGAVIKNSTISGNRASGAGGGLYLWALPTGIGVQLLDVTISGNQARTTGGGLEAAMGEIHLNNVTIVQNDSAFGGGLYSGATTSVTNSILAQNAVGNCGGNAASSGYNLDDAGSCLFTGPGDLSGLPADLGPLQGNGGETFTHALLPGSPALDAGNDATCLPIDQRWIPRPQGLHCDIGAFEAENPATATPPAVTSTLTPTRTSTLTPSPSLAAILFDPVTFSTDIVYAYGRSCNPKEVTVQVKVTPAEWVKSVGLFFRLEEKNGTRVGPWGGGLAMIPRGGGWHRLTLYGEDLIGGFQSNDEIWVAIQFAANGEDGQVLARSPVYRQVTLGKCYQ
jgi:CSLREA domain-containing protein